MLSPDNTTPTSHCTLYVHTLALQAATRVIPLVEGLPPRLKELDDQTVRAVMRVPAALSEGAGRKGRDRLHLFRIAYSSCKETSSLIELLIAVKAIDANAGREALAVLDRVQAMTWRLMNPR
jgi:four helix bundle protein